MMACLIKAWLTALDLYYRNREYNTEMPEIGRMVTDLSYGSDPAQRLDILVPPGRPPYPIVINVHGGGWLMGNKASYSRICHCFAAKGYLTANCNYRLTPRHRHPAQLQDIAAAVRWVYEHAPEYGGDPARIYLMGDSAGAHLVACYALAPHVGGLANELSGLELVPDTSLRALLLFYGIYSLRQLQGEFNGLGRPVVRSFLAPERADRDNLMELISPLGHITASMPPCFICCGELDALYAQSTALVEYLRRKDVTHQALLLPRDQYPDAWHGFLNYHRRPSARVAMQAALEFLEKQEAQSSASSDGERSR